MRRCARTGPRCRARSACGPRTTRFAYPISRSSCRTIARPKRSRTKWSTSKRRPISRSSRRRSKNSVELMASIEAHHLSKTYASRDGNVVALDDVSLNVTDSEFVSILGPSGCGKSTLLRIIDGLAKADRGTLFMDGKPIERPTQERGFVFQSFNLFPWRTVRGNIEFGMEIKGVPKSERHAIAQRLVE